MKLFPVLILIIAMLVGTFIYLVNKQLKRIAFYEKQGIKCYPNAKRWLLGNVIEFNEFKKAKESDELTEMSLKWMVQNMHRFVDKKNNEFHQWMNMFILELFGTKIVIGDPTILQGFQNDKSLLDKHKNSFMMGMMDERFQDNVLVIQKSSDQVKRRRAFINGFTGQHHFRILDSIIERVLGDFIKTIGTQDRNQVHDLRQHIINLFEQIITLYLLGRDISKDLVTMKVLQPNGACIQEKQLTYDALNSALKSAQRAFLPNVIFGRRNFTKSQQVSNENWKAVQEKMDEVVKEQIQIASAKEKDSAPSCFIDLLLESEVYQNDAIKMANDLFTALTGATDTSRNQTILALCHLAKCKNSREKVRSEVDRGMNQQDISDSKCFWHLDMKTDKYQFTHQVMNESFRFSPSVAFTDTFQVLKDCRIDNINFKKGTQLNFSPYLAHHNPQQWQHPKKFLPDRFDPSHELFKTPSGQARHPMSFIPFSVGERSCVGYMFAKTIIPRLVSKIIYLFDIELTEAQYCKDEADTYPIASTMMNFNPPIYVKFTPTDKLRELDQSLNTNLLKSNDTHQFIHQNLMKHCPIKNN